MILFLSHLSRECKLCGMYNSFTHVRKDEFLMLFINILLFDLNIFSFHKAQLLCPIIQCVHFVPQLFLMASDEVE